MMYEVAGTSGFGRCVPRGSLRETSTYDSTLRVEGRGGASEYWFPCGAWEPEEYKKIPSLRAERPGMVALQFDAARRWTRRSLGISVPMRSMGTSYEVLFPSF